jgi:ornithine cyclodeaminase/alanine dehydrogenase-like protein (mu-crystallin family)
MSGQNIPFLSGYEVRRHLSMPDAIRAMREAFVRISDGTARVPLRSHLDLPESNGVALFMPGFLPGSDTLGIKIVTLFGDNPRKDLPLIHALMVLLDGKTGAPLAVIDGETLTAIRTGAATGLATDVLARKDSETLVLFGAGIQSKTQLEAVATVRALKKVYIVDPDKKKADNFVAEMQPAYRFTLGVGEPENVLPLADIICTATTAAEPVFSAASVRPGTHINAIGAYKPDRREIPPETMAASLLFADERRACLSEAGDIVMAIKEGAITAGHITAELGEVLLGRHPGRTGEDEITLFKSVGNAAQDLAASAIILNNLRK